MTKIHKKIFIAINLSLGIMGVMFSVLQISGGVELYGVTEQVDTIPFEFRTLYNGEWQSQFTTKYHNNFPLRAFMVRTNNQLLYQMGAMINGSIVVGNDGYLFSDEYICNAFTNISDDTRKQIDEYVEKLIECQKILNVHQKELVYIITPSKVELCAEFLPERYKALVAQRAEITNNYDYLAYKLEQANIRMLDMTQILKRAEQEYPYFCKTGTHWNFYAAAIGAKELLKVLGNTVNSFEITFSEKPFETEKDLYCLSNIWKGKEENLYYKGVLDIEGNIDRRTVLEMGTSFSNEMVTELLNKDSEMLFDNYIRYQYFTMKSTYFGDQIKTETFIESEDLIDEICGADIILIENNNSYVPDSHIRFAQYIIDNGDIIKTRKEILEPIIFENDTFIIDFSPKGNSSEYVKTGFYDEEETGRWSRANTKIELYLNADSDIRIDFSNNYFCEKTQIMFNDCLLWDSEKDSVEQLTDIVIPENIIRSDGGNYLQVFTSKEILSPKAQGIGEDDRKLAQFWNKLIIRRGDKK